ncbi:MAG: SpoIIE family protein phosphatase, partial [Desulfobacterales bacterium]
HARLIMNLTAMNVAAIMYDFVFAGASEPEKDRQLISAVQTAGNVYFGLVFRLTGAEVKDGKFNEDARTHRLLDEGAWRIPEASGYESFYNGIDPLATFPELSEVSRGIGYLSIKPDRDGIFRRIPLLVQYGGVFFPSFALRAVCDFLNVPPERIVIQPGKIILRGAVYPGKKHALDIAVPVDARGNLRINFVGPWEKMKHYNFSDVYKASEDLDLQEIWRDELSGKIVLVSDICTGSADVGQVPTDPDFPLSGIHANTVNTLLSGSFLRETPLLLGIVIEILLLLGVTALSYQRSALVFTLGTVGLAGGYLLLVGAFVFLGKILLPAVRPPLLIFGAMIGLLIVSAIENARSHAATEKAREVAERDLEIGRKIQAGFFPNEIPAPAGWDIAAHFKPARQVAGDFYDVFELENGRFVALVIADVCDKGVGAALFMALIRSLVRANTIQGFDNCRWEREHATQGLDNLLLNTVRQTNNYIARTHSDSNMFATLFLGLLEPESGTLTYVNGGHEPPLLISGSTLKERLKTTGPAVGIMPDVRYAIAHARLHTGDLLFAFTDGITDAVNEAGEMFTRERLTDLLLKTAAQHTAAGLLRFVDHHLGTHIANAPQFDDITMVAIRRGDKLVRDESSGKANGRLNV